MTDVVLFTTWFALLLKKVFHSSKKISLFNALTTCFNFIYDMKVHVQKYYNDTGMKENKSIIWIFNGLSKKRRLYRVQRMITPVS